MRSWARTPPPSPTAWPERTVVHVMRVRPVVSSTRWRAQVFAITEPRPAISMPATSVESRSPAALAFSSPFPQAVIRYCAPTASWIVSKPTAAFALVIASRSDVRPSPALTTSAVVVTTIGAFARAAGTAATPVVAIAVAAMAVARILRLVIDPSPHARAGFPACVPPRDPAAMLWDRPFTDLSVATPASTSEAVAGARGPASNRARHASHGKAGAPSSGCGPGAATSAALGVGCLHPCAGATTPRRRSRGRGRRASGPCGSPVRRRPLAGRRPLGPCPGGGRCAGRGPGGSCPRGSPTN